MKRILLSILFLSMLIASNQIPAPIQTQAVLLKNGFIHTISDGTIENGFILFNKGKIIRIGKSMADPENTVVIDLQGKHVYPGLIAAVSSMGLVEVNAVKATRDYAETGRLNPNVRANVSYNPDSEIIPVTRSNGVLMVNVVPSSGLISGQSSLMMLDGWTWENATLQHPTGLHINWPRMSLNLGQKSKKTIKKQAQERQKRLEELDDLIAQVRAYAKLRKSKPGKGSIFHGKDLRLESMIPFVERNKAIFIHANEIRQIEAAVHWAKRQDIKIIIVGGRDSWRLTKLLKEENVPIIFVSVLSLPSRRFEDYDQVYKTPLLLMNGGVQFCISSAGNAFETAHQRNLPYHAAMASAFGLPKDMALRSITLSVAEILGVDHRVGSLAVGKDATLFITDGDPLEIRTNVEQCYIQGKKIDMSDRHKTLYKKYQEKYKQLGLIK